MPYYEVTGRDCCVDGFERLRADYESILLAYPDRDSTADSILAELVADLDSVMRREGFAFDKARSALALWFADGGAAWIAAELASLEWPADDLDDESGLALAFRLYLAERPGWRVSYEIVTPESAAEGDAAERGFIEPGEWRTELGESLKSDSLFDMGLRAALDLCQPAEDCGNGRDLSEADSRLDYRTGSEERRTLHAPGNITDSSFRRVKRLLGLRP